MRKNGKRTRNRKPWKTIQATEYNIIILSLSMYYTHEKRSSSSRNSSFADFLSLSLFNPCI